MNTGLEKRIERLEYREPNHAPGGVVIIYDANVPGDLDRKKAGVAAGTVVICIPDNGRPRLTTKTGSLKS